MLHADVQKEMEKEFEMALQDHIMEETKQGKDCAKIIKKQSKPDKIEHEISKNAQNPDQRTFTVQVNRPKAKIASSGADSVTSSFFIYKGIFDLKSTRAKVANL
nr:hypothetical protein [Tanacetum cinerariifolium]